MPGGADPEPEVRIVRMNSLDALWAVLDGVAGAGTGEERKWTTESARFQFRLSTLADKDLYLRFEVPGVTFRQTGPVRIAIHVNGAPFDSLLCAAPGEVQFRRSASGIRARPFDPLIVALEIDPPYIAARDHAKLGILLDEIGFVPSTPSGGRP